MLSGFLHLTLMSSGTDQVLETWAHPVDTVERSLKCLKAKNSHTRGMQFQGSIKNAYLMSLHLCNMNSLPSACQCRVCIGFDNIWEWKWIEALLLACTYCELCSQLWGSMHNAFSLTLAFCLSFAALLQAVIAGDLLKVSTEHWVSTFSLLFAGLIYCKFYHTSAQNIDRLLWRDCWQVPFYSISRKTWILGEHFSQVRCEIEVNRIWCYMAPFSPGFIAYCTEQCVS